MPAGVQLTKSTGDLHITTPGAVIDSMDITGLIWVEAPNVTIKNSVLRGRAVTSSAAIVWGNSPGLTIVDTEIFAGNPTWSIMGFVGSGATFVRTDIHDVVDAVHITGDNVTIRDSWFHGNLHYVRDPGQGMTPTHDDSIQIQAGTNILIENTVLQGSHNAAIQITQDRDTVHKIVIRDNWLHNGGCTVNIAPKGRGPIASGDVIIEGNTFGRDSKFANCGVVADGGHTPTMRDNWYTDGDPVRLTRH